MRNLFLSLVIVLCSCSNFVKKPAIPEKMVGHSSNSTVALVAPESFFDSDGKQWPFCTGTFVSKYEVLTAKHCIMEIGDEVRVATYQDYLATDGKFEGGRWTTFVVVRMNGKNDLALLKVKEEEKSSLPAHTVMELSDKSPNVGENVYIVGHPNFALWTFTLDIVSNASRTINFQGISGKFFQHQTPVFEGNSGGPVISMKGKLVGVVSLYTPHISQLNLSVHLDEVKAFLAVK